MRAISRLIGSVQVLIVIGIVAAGIVGLSLWLSPGELQAPPISSTNAAKYAGFRAPAVHLRVNARGQVVEHNCSDPKCTAVIGAEWAPDAIKASVDK